MAVIRANRESIDDRFSVLGFTVRSELPLFEIGLATDPELLKPANRGKRTPANFFTSRLLRALPSQRGEAVFLVPPEAVARFIGQPRVYFGLATYRESDRNTPVSLRLPDRGSMYVSMSGLTERGLRRTARRSAPNGYGYNTGGGELGWGGDAAGTPPAPSRDDDRARSATATKAPATANEPATYSDGYSDELWKAPPAALAPAPAAQGLAVRGRAPMAHARPLLVESYDQPSSWWDALTTQIGHFARGAMWFLGVYDTTKPPYSAICQVRVPDGSAEGAHSGTAFFIAPRLLLTAAHVVDGQTELIIVPGKNGAGTGRANEPFGRFKVTKLRKHGSYGTGNRDHDMALIHVPAAHAASSPNYFGLVEELTQSRPEGVVVSGYAAWWHAVSEIEKFVNANIDENRQHAHGGYIREIPTDGTFTYDLQTLAGTSGSPVYWIEDGAQPVAHLVGVHVAANDDHTNKGCRITQEKLTWIRKVAAEWGQTLTFSLGAGGVHALSTDADDDSLHDIGGPIPDGHDSDSHAEAQGYYGARSLTLTSPEDPLSRRFVAAASGNYRHVTGTRTIDKIVIHITDGGANINGTIGWFQNPDQRNAKGEHITVSAHYVIGQDGEIVQMVPHNDVAWHAGSANGTSIGIEHVANTKGLNPTVRQMEASSALVVWLCDKYGIDPTRTNILGHAEADKKTSHKACPNAVWNWDYYMELITTRSCVPAPASMPQSLSYTRAMSEDGADPALEPDEDSEEYGITDDIPDEAIAHAQSLQTRALAAETPDYPGTKRFVPAHANNYKKMKAGRVIDRIVIHITAGGPKIDGTIAWFQDGNRVNPRTGKKIYSSAHYIVGRDGEVVQMVHDKDKAHHASSANKRSIGIEHNANKPYSLNKRDLPPTEPQYEASAKLVAWLCAQHGVPVDREHIVGHKEASPKDNHDCPGSYWDWDHYMALVNAEAAALGIGSELGRAVGGSVGGAAGTTQPAVTSQALGRFYATAQEIIAPFYDPKDPNSALTCQDNAFSLAREEWFVGVEDTRSFPHSAICLLNMTAPDGSTYSGTGFYIGRNRILTCAHNLSGMSNVQIIPGRNGSGSKPFGETTVTSSSWRIAPGYSGDGDWNNDLAVIDRVSIAAPGGHWFEFLNATPSTHLPLVVCGYSGASNAVPGLTDIIDDQKQHLHGGYAQGMPNEDTIDYPILSLMGASGSPVYTLDHDGGSLSAKICAVHVSGQPAKQGLNRGCFITPKKIDWIEGRASTFALGYSGHARALGNDGPSDHAVHLIPQPDKNACWAASMAMLLAHRHQASRTPESVINEIGGSLATSYGWDLIKAAKAHYRFDMIEQPSNASLYHTPRQWAEWLNTYGPLWVVIVGAPHAVVIAGIRGNLDDAHATEVKVLNPWDTRVSFSNDAIDFNPANHGYEAWLPFADFASDFGNMAESNYGNWRILHLPVVAAQSQSLSAYGSGLCLAPPPPTVRPLNADGERREPIEPSRVAGTRMSRVIGEAGACRWRLDQLEGMKSAASPSYEVSSAAGGTAKIALDNWPAIEGAPTPLPLTVEFRHGNGSVGDVRIVAGMPANLAYGVEVVAKIEDCADVGNVARVRVRVDYRFRGLAQGNPDAVVELCLRGDGQYERENGWAKAPNALSPAAA